MLRLLSIPLALLILLIAALVWSSSTADKRADFVFVNRGDIITLDTNQMSYLQDMRIAYGIWEGLYVYDPMTLAPIPGCATGEASADKKVWTFHINPNAKWSNGDPVTADDFIFAWRRMLESPGEYTYLHYYIKGAEKYLEDFAEGKSSDFATVGIKSPDPKTLIVTLENPVTFFLDLVAFPPFFPLHKPSMEKFAIHDAKTGRVSYNPQFTRPPNLVTNGAFILSRWDFKRRLILTRNPYYWNPESVKSKTIEMAVVEDSLTQLLRYDSGLVDWVSAVPTELAAELKGKGRPDLRSFTGFGTTYILLMMAPKLNNGKDNPLADIRIRHALAMSIDRKPIVDTITRMGEVPAFTFVPPNCFPGYQQQKGIEPNPKRAKELLAEAGYPNGGVLPGVTYLYRSDIPSSKEVAQNLTRQWNEKLGLRIPLEAAEGKIRRQRVNDKDFSICVSDWIGDYGDPSTFTDMYQTHSDNNNSGWGNPEYDQLVQDAAREPDEQKRLRMIEKAESILLAETPIIPLYYITNQYLFRDNVKGINLNPRNMTMLKAVQVVRN
jgi:oligopeptide transport system substrate-binding protein